MNLFAEDAKKLQRVIMSQNDCFKLQEGLDKIYEWEKKTVEAGIWCKEMSHNGNGKEQEKTSLEL